MIYHQLNRRLCHECDSKAYRMTFGSCGTVLDVIRFSHQPFNDHLNLEGAAKLFQENLKYADGTPVRVVIADTTIGRVCETAYSVICYKISSQRICYAREFLFRLTKKLLANPRT